MPSEPERLNGARVGLVGASGYIGGALATSLIRDGASPRLFGRTARCLGDREIVALTAGSDLFEGLDCVVHLSGIATSRASEDDLRRANVDLAVETARRAAAAGVRRFIFVSSLHVHGKTAARAVTPETPFRNDNAYGRSKAAAETALARVAAQTGLELIIVRPPMVYGPGSGGGFRLLAKLVQAGPPLPFARARARRSFCSIDNLVSALRHLIITPTPPSVLLPADPEDFDTASLVAAMAEAVDRRIMLWPAPRGVLAAGLGLAGRSEMIVSLFEPLRIDRTHWAAAGWRPVETGAEGVRKALKAAPDAPLALYLTNVTPYFLSHRLALAHEARRRGFRVAVAGGDVDQYRPVLEGAGLEPIRLPDFSRGFSPLADARAALALGALIRRRRPAVVHATGLKTMFLCALARWVGKPRRVVCIVTGLGLTYVDNAFRSRLARLGVEAVLRTLLRRREVVTVFQNNDDYAEFLERRVVRRDNAVVIKGSGVDTARFAATRAPDNRPPIVVFPARLLKSKGVLDFAAAAKRLHDRKVEGRFVLVGDIDPDNPDSIDREMLEALIASGAVEAWGFRRDMADVFAGCDIVCLPSYYREGVPKALIEAASSARPIVTADTPGCREIVVHGINGRLCAPRNPASLADMLEPLLKDADLRRLMGEAGRRRVEAEFSDAVVLGATADLYTRAGEGRSDGRPSP